jgi:hypothetical protein
VDNFLALSIWPVHPSYVSSCCSGGLRLVADAPSVLAASEVSIPNVPSLKLLDVWLSASCADLPFANPCHFPLV